VAGQDYDTNLFRVATQCKPLVLTSFSASYSYDAAADGSAQHLVVASIFASVLSQASICPITFTLLQNDGVTAYPGNFIAV
jgi:hypothetical protein